MGSCTILVSNKEGYLIDRERESGGVEEKERGNNELMRQFLTHAIPTIGHSALE